MNEQQRDPPRWLESGYLSDELSRELVAYGTQTPAAASKLRMLEQLSTQLADAPLAAKPFALAKVKLLVVGSAILAGAVGLLQFKHPEPAILHATDSAPSASTRLAPIAEVKLADAVIEPTPEEEDVPVKRVRRAVLAPREVAPPEAIAAPVATPPRASNPDVLAELTMLARARRALLNDPARALELSEEHARDYPRGTFDEEREVLAIESLLKLGRSDEARARERAFEAAFPRSAQIAHLAKLIANASK